jgi:MFS family permease
MRIRNPHLILAVLSGLNLVNYLDRYIVAAVGPKLAEELGLSDSKFGFVVTAFMIGYFATSPLFGALGDKHRDEVSSRSASPSGVSPPRPRGSRERSGR